MKKVITGCLIVSALSMAACNNAGEKSISTDETTSTNMSTSDDSMNMDHTGTGTMSNDPNMTTSGTAMAADQFAMDAASGGMMEVELGKYGSDAAVSKEVKDLAKMIRDDHTKANSELKSIASNKNITIPSEMKAEHKSHVDMLKDKKGAEFEKEYLRMMVEDHEKDIAKFRDASANLSDPELKAFAEKTLPVLQKHLDRAKELHQKQNNQ